MRDMYILLLFFIPFFAFAQTKSWPVNRYNNYDNYRPKENQTFAPPTTKPTLPNPLSLDHLKNPIKKNLGPLRPAECKLNIMPLWYERSFHTYHQVWICTYADSTGTYTLYAAEFDSNDKIKLLYHDLTKTNGKEMLFDTRTRQFVSPPLSAIFHTQIIMREINKENILLPDDKPLPKNLLGLHRPGGELLISGNIFESPSASFQLPLGVMTAESKPPITAGGISFELLAPNTPVTASPNTGPIPNSGGLGGNKPVITPQTPSDIFNNNMPFAGGFSIHINLLAINWRTGSPNPMVSDDGKALIFPFGYKDVPFAVILTDGNNDHAYEGHLVEFKFFDPIKQDWSQIKFIKEFPSYEKFVQYLKALPKPKK